MAMTVKDALSRAQGAPASSPPPGGGAGAAPFEVGDIVKPISQKRQKPTQPYNFRRASERAIVMGYRTEGTLILGILTPDGGATGTQVYGVYPEEARLGTLEPVVNAD